MDCFPWKMLTDNLDTPGLGLIFFQRPTSCPRGCDHPLCTFPCFPGPSPQPGTLKLPVFPLEKQICDTNGFASSFKVTHLCNLG